MHYNPEACAAINEYGKKHNYKFQHALNGEEFLVPGTRYKVDGYDKEKNVVIEYYEKAHEGMLENDLIRQKEIENILNCKFIILHESDFKYNKKQRSSSKKMKRIMLPNRVNEAILKLSKEDYRNESDIIICALVDYLTKRDYLKSEEEKNEPG